MLLLIHIIIAFSGIILSGVSLLSPSKRKLKSSYALVAGTFLTGTILIILQPAHLVQACFTGLLYLGVVGVLLVFAQQRFAQETTSTV